MKRGIIKNSYIFEEDINLAPRLAFELLERINISDNVVINYFRINNDKLNLDKLKLSEFEFYKDTMRNDNTFIYFRSIKSFREILEIYDPKYIMYPIELDFHHINCSFNYYITNFSNRKINKGISRNFIDFSVSVYDGLIVIKFSRVFYDERNQLLDRLIDEWENTFSNIKIRKSKN